MQFVRQKPVLFWQLVGLDRVVLRHLNVLAQLLEGGSLMGASAPADLGHGLDVLD